MEYAERLTVPLRWWVQATMLVATFWLAVLVAMPFTAAMIVTGVAAAVAAAILLSYGSATIEVKDGQLKAGRAHIATLHVGAVETLDAEQTRRVAGVEADARAFLLLRPYLKRSVKVALVDPADPTPYWLISTRHPIELSAALTEASASTAS